MWFGGQIFECGLLVRSLSVVLWSDLEVWFIGQIFECDLVV